MTCSPIAILWRAVAIRPALGLTPPSIRLPHSSTLFAPPRSVAMAESRESTQTSTVRLLTDTALVLNAGAEMFRDAWPRRGDSIHFSLHQVSLHNALS